MEMFNSYINFPQQRVSAAEKSKPKWYANCIDYIIAQGVAMNNRAETERKLNILHGDIPNDFYKKTLNPYNANNEKYTRFPATMRNLDIMKDIVRRYVSEYYTGINEFIIGATNPEIVLNKNAKLKQEISLKAAEAFKKEFEAKIQEAQNQAAQQGGSAGNIDPKSLMPDPEEFITKFNQNYIDDASKQGQDVLDYIRSATSDIVIYLSAFFEYVALGECYTHTEVRGEQIVKEEVPSVEAYPIPNGNFFVEDHDMFARRSLLSYNQILDMFDDYLSSEDRKFLEDYYGRDSSTGEVTLLYSKYFETYPDVCEKFAPEERNIFKKEPVRLSSVNGNLWEVWHVVWKSEARKGILTYVNEIGFTTQRTVDESYKLNKEAGDISIEWEYEPQIYEGYRIGGRSNAIYPIKARPIAYQRKNKLPYNGIMEVIPFMGKFSIIDTVTPFQIMRNIFAYHREMVIAKNKMLVLLLPKSLVASKADDVIYRMAADGTLLVDDSEDANSQKMAQIRLLNANMGDYISQITDLMKACKEEAWDSVDMNAQRYGDIANSAAVGITKEAVNRSSMGTVVITAMFNQMRLRDYQRDIEFAKVAYVDGLTTSYFDAATGTHRYLSIDTDSFLYSDYGVYVKNDHKEKEKVDQLRQWAFSAAQNGDLDMAIAAIDGNNVAQIKATVQKFMEIKQQHEEQMKQLDAMLKSEELQNKLKEIEAQGTQDKELEQLKFQHEMALKYVDVDMSNLAPTDNTGEQERNRIQAMGQENKRQIDQQKLNLSRQQLQADLYNKAADRSLKLRDIESKERIAKMNKNKYDK